MVTKIKNYKMIEKKGDFLRILGDSIYVLRISAIQFVELNDDLSATINIYFDYIIDSEQPCLWISFESDEITREAINKIWELITD